MKAYCVYNSMDKHAHKIFMDNGIEVVFSKTKTRTMPSEEELITLSNTYDILIVGIRAILTKKVYENSKRLKIIGTISNGVDHICNEFLEDDRFTVINTPKANITSVAEHTLALILALSKKIVISNEGFKKGVDKSYLDSLPTDLYNKTIGVVGYGKIGKKAIELCKCFNMKILCFDKFTQNSSDNRVEFVEKDYLCKNADIISVHLPLADSTYHIIGSDEIKMMKSSALLINTSRTTIIDEDAAILAVNENRLAGLAMDIDVKKYENTNNSNIILTPHIAGVTIDSVKRMAIEMAEGVVRASSRF